MKTFYRKTIIGNSIILVLLFSTSCRKDALNIKPDQALVVPTTLQDFQGMLDNVVTLNEYGPAMAEMGAGDFYLSYANWQSLSDPFEQNCYIWAKDIYNGETAYDWDSAYQKIFYTNVVLDGLKKININNANQSDYNNIKGQALFVRAFSLFQMAQEFAKTYNAATAKTDLGIVLRLTADVNAKSTRATVQQTYDQIVSDLTEAVGLLPDNPKYLTRASKPAAEALLSRTYLSMSDYPNALKSADASLKIDNELIDYNKLDSTAYQPLQMFNNEVLYHEVLTLYLSFYFGLADPALVNSYDQNDLRRVMFFSNNGDGTYSFKGSYGGDLYFFGGMATDEMYLNRAECYARQGDASSALQDLNALLKMRYKTGTFVPVTATGPDDALAKILGERRKELCFRSIRWTDLRRLNQDSRFAVTLSRTLNGQTYTLPPNDPRYVYPFSNDIISLTGIPQNPR